MDVYRGNAFTPINLSNFPITEKTIQVSRSNGMPDGSWAYVYLNAGGRVFSSNRSLKGSNVSIGGAKDLPWYARSGIPQSRSVVGTVYYKYTKK
jgi:hypothetical protein